MQTISLIEHLYLIHFPPPDCVEGGKRKLSYSEQVMKVGDCITGETELPTSHKKWKVKIGIFYAREII